MAAQTAPRISRNVPYNGSKRRTRRKSRRRQGLNVLLRRRSGCRPQDPARTVGKETSMAMMMTVKFRSPPIGPEFGRCSTTRTFSSLAFPAASRWTRPATRRSRRSRGSRSGRSGDVQRQGGTVRVRAEVGYTINGEGDGGIAGFAKGGAKVSLADADGGTLLTMTSRRMSAGPRAHSSARTSHRRRRQEHRRPIFSQFRCRCGRGAGARGASAAPAVSFAAARRSDFTSSPRAGCDETMTSAGAMNLVARDEVQGR